MHAFIALLKRFHSDERGIFAVIFGVMAIVLVALAGAAVDYTSMETARTRAQIALDSAALGLGPKIYDDDVTEDDLIAEAQAVVRERLANVPQVTVNVTAADINSEAGTLRLTGDVTVPMAFVQLVGIQTLTAGIVSEATKGSINLEVALALDITLSMAGADKIDVLETAASGLIDTIVKDEDHQEPTYSRMAIVPYSMGVNVSSYANTIRGQPWPAKPMSTPGAVWAAATGSGSITAITRNRPGVITSAGHGLVTGDIIGINDVRGMTQINNQAYRVVKINNNTFSLQQFSNGATVNTNGYSNYSSGGTWRKCALTTCEVTVTATGHGFVNNDWIVTTDVGGLSGLNNKAWQVKDKNDNSFKLKDSVGPEYGSSYSGGGNVWCTTYTAGQRPCEFYRYQTASGGSSYRTARITTCATERAGANLYTNVAPSGAATWLGRHYPDNSTNACPSNVIVPLTDNKDVLHAETDDLTVTGSTAGHIGLAWAWYLLSPNFGALWADEPDTFVPANPTADDAEPVMKVIVLMTDGLFNTAYCNGVVSKDSDSIAGGDNERINCNAPAGSTAQGIELCDQIATNGTPNTTADDIIIYTVAFALDEIRNETQRATVRSMLENCATDNGGFYEATNGEGLLAAFDAIGKNITDLRLSL